MKSLQSKIIGLIIFIMLVTGGIIISISNKEIGDAMLEQQNMLSKHVLSLVELNIKGGYNNLIIDKIDSVTRYKNLLKNRMDLIVRMIDRQRDQSLKFGIPDDSAQQLILNWIQASGTAYQDKAFVTDKDLIIIAHPDSALNGVHIANFTGMKHKTIAEELMSATSVSGPIISVVNWEMPGNPAAKILLCLQRYEPWDWIIGTAVNIGDIEVEAGRKLDKIIETLEKTFKEIRIADTGFAFLFDNVFNVLAITDESTLTDFQQARNQETGNMLLEDMVASAVDESGFLAFESEMFAKGRMISYVSYFKPLGWYIGVTVPVCEIKEPSKVIISKQSGLIGIILLMSILLTAWLVSRISKPLNILASRVKEFSDSDLTQEEGEDAYIQNLAEQYRDEVGRLAHSFAFMKKQLRNNIRKLVETTAENERINSELNVATAIQLGLLPKIFPPFPERDDLGIYASLEPAKEVGGDLYDFYFVDENKLCFTIGDVSGKGVPAALMMAITKTLIKTSAGKNASPADMMTEVNDAIASDNPQSMFVTLFIGIMDLETGHLVFSNGGHNPPILVSGKNECRYVKDKSGPVVGIMDGIPFKELSLDLAPDEALFLYTDGVTEAQNPDKEFYTEETLLEKVSGLAGTSCEETVTTIKSDLKVFADVEPQFDDIAMLMVRYKGKTP